MPVQQPWTRITSGVQSDGDGLQHRFHTAAPFPSRGAQLAASLMLAVQGLIYNKLPLTDGLLLHESADYNVFNK